MKISTDLIIFDLEATSNQETKNHKPKIQTNNFIIEIGAVFLNRNLEVVDEFQHFVKPEEEITPFIEELTGISNDTVKDKDNWFDVSLKFEQWALKHTKNFKSVRLCAWGNYFDIPLLRKCYSYYDKPYPWSGTALDCKTISFLWCALSGRRTDKLSVEHLASLMNISPEGDFHRAIVDAQVQTKIVQRALHDLSSGFFLPNSDNKHYDLIKISN
jgi:DNA polymerase III epsilon subunit-like protein